MSNGLQEKIAFQVETERVLQILSKEIYDSPLALLRENVQNAYDAVLMRCVEQQTSVKEAVIEIIVEPKRLTIIDQGVGMTEEVLRNNFWKAGSSGKNTELARKAGVIGTFGIGAMANFGVCSRLQVETRHIASKTTLISSAEKSKLSISEECIDLKRVEDARPPGTKLIAELEKDFSLSEDTAKNYLLPYVKFLPAKVLLNGQLISQQNYVDLISGKSHQKIGESDVKTSQYSGHIEIFADSNGQVLAKVTQIKLQGTDVLGELVLGQGFGQLFGLRNYFGLAPVPVTGFYQLGGVANLIILHPTAGREALSRESIDHVNHLVSLFEDCISESLATTEFADRNVAFLQYIVSKGKLPLAKRVTIEVLPEAKSVELGKVKDFCKGKTLHYYTGHDATIQQTFAHDSACLLRISPNNPRRQTHLQYVRNVLRVAEVPDKATITKEYKASELSVAEASLLARIVWILNEDYLLPQVDIVFADISHGVSVLVSKKNDAVQVHLAKGSNSLRPVLETYQNAYEVFDGFVKDFVRVHLYQKLNQYIPSSTREGVDALAKLLQRNRELFRYEENDFGNVEPLLGDYLAGTKTLAEVITTARSNIHPQTQFVRHDQIGSLEEALPDVVESPIKEEPQPGQEFEPTPPILREDISCELKILVTSGRRQQLRNFELFLALSDRLFKREGDFFRYPHTTKLIWAGHRVIYIFTEASGRLNVYYDIELREPLDAQTTGGGMFPTTTIITKNRIYVPVPQELVPVFQIKSGAKEFYVRFDTITSA